MTAADHIAPDDPLEVCAQCDHPSCERRRDLADDLGDYLADVSNIASHEAGDLAALIAERVLRAIAHRRRQLADAEQVVAAEIERLHGWLDTQRRRLDTSWLEDRLADYHRARLADDPRAKTIHLPSGTLRARKQPDQWLVEDVETVVSWALADRPELVRTKHELDRVALKRLLRPAGQPVNGVDLVVDPDSGEPVPGVSYTAGEVRFSVDTEAKQ